LSALCCDFRVKPWRQHCHYIYWQKLGNLKQVLETWQRCSPAVSRLCFAGYAMHCSARHLMNNLSKCVAARPKQCVTQGKPCSTHTAEGSPLILCVWDEGCVLGVLAVSAYS
jgi:hypothetical protein